MRNVVALYRQTDDALHAIQSLSEQGYRKEDITLIAHDVTGRYTRAIEEVRTREGQDLTNGIGIGAVIGGVLGGLGGLLVSMGVLEFAAFDSLVNAGPVLAVLAGLVGGAVAGGVIGALIDLAIPENTASAYAKGLRQGGTLLVVRTANDRAEQAGEIMNRFRPLEVDRKASWWQVEFENHDPDEIHLENPPLAEVLATQDNSAFKEWTVEYLEIVEEPLLRKEVQVAEEVRVYREVRERDQTIRDTVRRQEVEAVRTEPEANKPVRDRR
jgi:hypothetical protein